MLKPGGRLAIMYLSWLPDESSIARMSEQMVLKYNPLWSGAYMGRTPFGTPPWVESYSLAIESHTAFDVDVQFTRHTWNGRMKACRGIGASLSPSEVDRFDREHMAMLDAVAHNLFPYRIMPASRF
jgi:hypothetical protein